MERTLAVDDALLEAVINHVALPPRLPAKADNRFDEVEQALSDLLLNASKCLRDHIPGDLSQKWDVTRKTLQICSQVNAGGKLDRRLLLSELQCLNRNDTLIIHVAEQNAGLLIRRDQNEQGETVIFEAFEASPPSHDVLAAGNALEWNFPEKSISIPYPEFTKFTFQDELVAFLEQASTESIMRFAARANKAGTSIVERRDTAKPFFITQMLMTLLEAIGHPMHSALIHKRIRDDVCWTDGAERPWRRSAYWLVLRVGLQRHLCEAHKGETGRVHYKFLLCIVLAHVIEHAVKRLDPQLVAFLVAKLARRLDKLEVAKKQALPDDQPLYDRMFATFGDTFRRATKWANDEIEVAWGKFKRSVQRCVPPLSRRADPSHLKLDLPNSAPYLEQVLSRHQFSGSAASSFVSKQHQIDFNVSGVTTRRFKEFADQYYSLSEFETRIEEKRLLETTSTMSQEERCLELAQTISEYLDQVGGAYDQNPEQKSIMILTVLELWASMDQCATECFDLLTDFGPSISPESFDCLHLIRVSDMCRLQQIETHLRNRCKACKNPSRTIFDKLVKGCFAERFYEESEASPHLQSLHRSIEETHEIQRSRKESEWQKKSADYAELEESIAASTCLFTMSVDNIRIHDDRKCRKCFLQRKARRMRIDVYEHPLPSNVIEAKAVLFELRCPRAFRAYRSATWRVIGELASPTRVAGIEPRLILPDHKSLKNFMVDELSGVTLASAKKSFTATHYRDHRFPVSIDQICVPSGLKWSYFDPSTKIWLSTHTQKPTLAHHVQLTIPSNSPLAAFALPADHTAGLDGPSSYEIIASQTSCPSKLSVHEFMAYRGLLSGTFRRWPSMLVELGSSNLNFSTEAVTLLMCHLAAQVGPAFESDPLRGIHSIFRDEPFCESLMEQISIRLDGISSNWRESNCMEMLLTLILRLCFATARLTLEGALRLLEKVRMITIRWIRHLRTEIHRSTSTDVSQKCSHYALCAALLCRRTFTVFSFNDIDTIYTGTLQYGELESYIECSITLQDNLIRNPNSLPLVIRNALIRDLKMVHRLHSILSSSLQASPNSLCSAINNVWPQSESGVSRTFSAPQWYEPPHESWITLSIPPSTRTKQQTIQFHLLEGHLLVDGQPMGKLPAGFRESLILEDLFGKQNLLTYPSALHGMSHTLAFNMNGHQVHFGVQNGVLVVQACLRDTILEYVPREVFRSASSFDLPASLVDNCMHWLDLLTGQIDIRQKPDIWKQRTSTTGNWLLDFRARTANRRSSSLVDPSSLPSKQITRIFDRFEYTHNLTVYQPARGGLSVELRRLELTFFVNQKSLLECRELRSEIHPDQDAGTWYGLQSKIVLRDAINPRNRIVIVPLGVVKYARSGIHLTATVANDGSYGKFSINDVLGRLDCPAEPRLLYLKAHLHACTSFVVADPLTGRTGTEEALHCLKSGHSQPWTALNQKPLDILASIAKLTPTRAYYPKDMKEMEQILWNPDLTTTVQRDEFQPLVEAIWKTSETLWTFGPKTIEHPPVPASDNTSHLLHRSLSRRRLHQRLVFASIEKTLVPDLPYRVRGCDQDYQARCNVYESVSLMRDRPIQLHTTTKLAEILEKWPIIGGLDREFVKVLLSDRLDVEFAPEWGPLVQLCRTSGLPETHRMMFLFALMSFRHDADMDVVRSLIAFATLEVLKSIEPPRWPSYTNFRLNHSPTVHSLMQLTKHCCVAYPGDERSTFGNSLTSKMRSKLEAAELAHEQRAESGCKALAQFVLEQWPCPKPTVEGFTSPPLVDICQAVNVIEQEWQRLFQNSELSAYMQQVQSILDLHQAPRIVVSEAMCREHREDAPTGRSLHQFPSLSQDLIKRPGPKLPKGLNPNAPHRGIGDVIHESGSAALGMSCEKTQEARQCTKPAMASIVSRETKELYRLVEGVLDSKSKVRHRYGQSLMQSLNALNKCQSSLVKPSDLKGFDDLPAEISNAQEALQEQFNCVCMALNTDDSRSQWLQDARLWPCLTPVTLLEQLRSTEAFRFGKGMKEGLVNYALAITRLQRLLRIEDAKRTNNRQRLSEEQRNFGHDNWQALDNPDWLLIEIDSNILIRRNQVDVAVATISPSSSSSSVLQMNMGQGKTSCIMPMVAAVLADSKKLLRVVVPQPLLLQTAQLLQARLGGLLGREVRHIPFNRKTSTSVENIKVYWKIHNMIRTSSGVMVALPESILSFMLSGLQRLSDARLPEATNMVNVQDWMRKWCRDVLDECDFTLAVRTQLIYPSGAQTVVDGQPHRWETAETLLRLVESHLSNLQQAFPQSIEVTRRPQGRFPVVYFLRKDVEDALIARLVDDVVYGSDPIISTQECLQTDRLAVKQFISEGVIHPQVAERISHIFDQKPAVRQNIYLLRGLLVHRILLLTLKKRWNVQYGLHPGRDPIAVPFHAKGVPSEQAEWGHPDVAILFTCLAFYFRGLELAQLRQILEHVMKSDDPSNEYDRWIHDSKSLPDALREWNVINVDDEAQLLELWLHIRYNVVVIDYFLNHFVFPKHAKQFQTKLQASGWDIPLCSLQETPGAEKSSPALTTGFSGTNDNRSMLPLTIKQHDLPGLSHTNAEVLTYLLQPRNRKYVLAADTQGRRLSETDLLRKLHHMKIRTLIDAGAQILECDNLTLVKDWLKIDHAAPAAVYFNAENKAIVLYRRGSELPLSASPFADDLGECLVYLDEAHTRGTDLRLPFDTTGALTLGLGQTKDHTVQAAMRLRQLATTQSVVYLSPPEVHQSILDLRKKAHGDHVDSYDVICWLLEQTCSSIEQIQPLYYSQGTDFCRRSQAALDNQKFLTNSDDRMAYLGVLKEREKLTLEQLYTPTPKMKSRNTSNMSPRIATVMEELNNQRKGFQDSGIAVQSSALQEVEQEREVAFEVEAVREVQKQPRYSALSFPGLHADIRSFAKTGRLTAGYLGYEPAFAALQRTPPGAKHRIDCESFASKLFVSKEFTKTVRLPTGQSDRTYLRPVNWILWAPVTEIALIIIPEEANIVIPLVSREIHCPTYLLTYAAPVTRRMLHFNDLKFYSMPNLPGEWIPPTWLTIGLGIFAGRLYFEYREYSGLQKFLGIQGNHEHGIDTTDGAFSSGDMEDDLGPKKSAHQIKSFTKQPLIFLQEWLAITRKGQDFSHTPMGFVCNGKPLLSNHPFFLDSKNKDVVDTATSGVSTAHDAKGQSDQPSRSEDVDTDYGMSEAEDDNDLVEHVEERD